MSGSNFSLFIKENCCFEINGSQVILQELDIKFQQCCLNFSIFVTKNNGSLTLIVLNLTFNLILKFCLRELQFWSWIT